MFATAISQNALCWQASDNTDNFYKPTDWILSRYRDKSSPFNSTHYAMLHPQNGGRIVAIDSVTSLHPNVLPPPAFASCCEETSGPRNFAKGRIAAAYSSMLPTPDALFWCSHESAILLIVIYYTGVRSLDKIVCILLVSVNVLIDFVSCTRVFYIVIADVLCCICILYCNQSSLMATSCLSTVVLINECVDPVYPLHIPTNHFPTVSVD